MVSTLLTTDGVIPQALFSAEIGTFYMEFLKMSIIDRTPEEIAKLKNHAILKLDFKAPYDGTSFSSLCTAVITLKQRITLGHIIRAITDNHLHHFYFCTVDEKYYGCRDFVTQAIAQLVRYNYIYPDIGSHFPQQQPLPSNNLYQLLGHRFLTPGGTPSPCPVDKGWFRYYDRVLSDEMRYNA
ncbi:hypothetical protein A7C99_4949 [Trichophyton rubrum]|uniref:DUF7770 domain-containing protein n=1 Tax=Trichophyton rubrum TaxID=5551 RepID=A0A178EW09_TRIRU|nr:hypothetical protein HL42_6533 [Trichophyton rubrum]OAL64290.1 hypothetical protein A7C99_4949 [Trichophyton rubrum]